MRKVIFQMFNWNNTWQVNENIVEEILLSTQPGKNMVLFGSSNLALTLIQNKLIDEYQVMIPCCFRRRRQFIQRH